MAKDKVKKPFPKLERKPKKKIEFKDFKTANTTVKDLCRELLENQEKYEQKGTKAALKACRNIAGKLKKVLTPFRKMVGEEI